jgi:hypothetical protein
MADYPPIDRSYVVSYASNDRDYPVIGIKRDPRTAGYKVPEDLSPHPDSKRYPNHVFTGAQPSAGDQIVTHVYEILPAPWVPFTRYDDDLGPVQGRRRAVKNEGQQADLAADKKVSYEGRDGSAIVSNEIEETWSIKTDEDGNSLFPIRDRDFYDASRGAVQERRQLFVPTGEEEGTLENINGVITQTSYEPYNEFLSVKIVQTYKVDGPQLIGKSTNNEGQLITVTTQRKGAVGYIPPNPTATRTVEVSREDAESVVERIVDTPSVFSGESKSVERPDPVPQKFRVKIPVRSQEQTIAGTIQTPQLVTTSSITELSKSEQQVTEFVKQTRTTSRILAEGGTINGLQYTQEMGGGFATVEETYPFAGTDPQNPEFGTLSDEIEDVGDGTKIRRKVKLPVQNIALGEFDESGNPITVPSMPILVGQEYDESLDLVIPFKQLFASPQTTSLVTGNRKRVNPRDVAHSQVIRYDIEDIQQSLDEYYWEIPDMISISLPDKLKTITFTSDTSGGSASGAGFGNTYSFSKSNRGSASGDLSYEIEQGFSGNIPTIRAIFFLPKGSASPQDVLNKLRTEKDNQTIDFWPNVRPQSYQVAIVSTSFYQEDSESVSFDSGSTSTSSGGSVATKISTVPATLHPELPITTPEGNSIGSFQVSPSVIPATEYEQFPTGLFLYQINASPYRFSYVRVEALLVDVKYEYV